ncbi:MAG TPA: hypothetical protein VFG30_25600 [Polyangiales bacterium]|jgi:hypothetical protein|nr:hypothetical protein [Polyangiales bacterium]
MRYVACLGLLLLMVASGCAYNRQYFRPTERVRGQTMQGYPESFYDLVGSKGRFGEAKVWTHGAYRKGDKTVIEVALELHNTSGNPIEVSADDLRLDPVRGSKGELKQVRAAETGTFGVGPESRASLHVHFILPDGWLPGHVRNFGFAWKLKNAEQSYAQVTPFREEEPYYPTTPPGYLYSDPMYPCSPYDLNCVGFYGSWPYGGRYGYPGPPVIIERAPPVERRRIEVR